MSPSNPNDFIGSLVEMAKAYEELPDVKQALEIERGTVDLLHKQVQDRELSILSMKSEIDLLNQRIRSLEVERDEAQFHALEADDRTARALDFIKATFGNAGSLIQALEPPRVDATQPVDTPAGVTNIPINTPKPEGVSVPTGEPAANSAAPSETAHSAPVPTVSPEPSPAPEVATQSDPIAASAPMSPNTASSETVASPGSVSQEQLASSPDAPPAPNAYAGRTYSEVAKTGHWPTRDEWLAGGGTVDNWYA